MYKILLCLACLVLVVCPVVCLAGDVTDAPGTPVDSLDLLDLGINPDFFLFTGNTMYDYNGTYELDIVGVGADPSTITSLEGLTIQQVLVILGDSGGTDTAGGDALQPSSPEPATSALCLAGSLTFLAYKRHMQLKKPRNG